MAVSVTPDTGLVSHDPLFDLSQRRTHGPQLAEDIEAVFLILDHPDDTGHLAMGASQAWQLILVCGMFHGCVIYLRGV